MIVFTPIYWVVINLVDSNEIQQAVGKVTVLSVYLGVIKPATVRLWYSNGTRIFWNLAVRRQNTYGSTNQSKVTTVYT